MDSLLPVLAQTSTIDWNKAFEMPNVIFVVGGVVGGLIAILSIVITNLRGYHESKQANQIKADMIQRGFSSEEIARVIESSPGKGDD
ncbi:MAG: hypothetical protein AAF517_17275 [Planctomycetota bacterium]